MLYFSIKINFGKLEYIYANTGPPPSNSNNAGKAQHMHILRLENKLESVNIVNFFGILFLDIIFIFYYFFKFIIYLNVYIQNFMTYK